MSTEVGERREEYFTRLNEIGDRLTRLEAMRESESEGTRLVAGQLVSLTKEIHAMSLQLNTLETQRNTIIGVAAVCGSLVTAIGQWVYKTMIGR